MKKFGEWCRDCRALLVLSLRCLLWIDQCVGQSDNSSSAEFKSLYPFSEAAGDNVVDVGDDNCDGPVRLPVTVFNQRTLFVSVLGSLSGLGRNYTSDVNKTKFLKPRLSALRAREPCMSRSPIVAWIN